MVLMLEYLVLTKNFNAKPAHWKMCISFNNVVNFLLLPKFTVLKVVNDLDIKFSILVIK